MRNRPILYRIFLYLGCSLGIILVLLMYILLSDGLHINNECEIRRTIGLYCPTCGCSRMVLSIIHFKFYQAFRYNPFVFISLPVLIFVYVKQGICYIFMGKSIKGLDKFVIVYFIVIFIFGVLRNIPALSFMAPAGVQQLKMF